MSSISKAHSLRKIDIPVSALHLKILPVLAKSLPVLFPHPRVQLSPCYWLVQSTFPPHQHCCWHSNRFLQIRNCYFKITGHFAIERVEKMALWISTADKQDLDGIPFTSFGREEGSRSENYDPCIFSLIHIFIPGSQLWPIENESLKRITFFLKKDILIASPLKSP